jgi:hypothetical protein
MKTSALFFSALSGFAVVGFSGAAQASTISATLTGTVTGGATYASGYPSPGADPALLIDYAHLFGGGSLYGATATLSFTYNADLLNSNGSYTSTTGEQIYSDHANDSALTVSATIDSLTYSMTSVAPTSGGGSNEVVTNCDPAEQFCNGATLTSAVYVDYDGFGEYMYFGFNGAADLPLIDLTNEQAVQNFVSNSIQAPGLAGAVLDIQTFAGFESLIVTPQSSSPEPTTLGLLAMGLGGVALMKRNRGKMKNREARR